ncbi:uncharacterized protein LOC120419805 [Culex pipiens pallens]|uniref:uncharacterized protein LOC120419805 n=1 Tax=Culex pipiens pallens TaxID=42434 RepID=UPI001953DB86|nr:uncharacterized protein LOC120419805 [Culex pipiens pallens]
MLDATEVLLAFLLLGGVAAFLTRKSKSKRKSLRRKLFTRRKYARKSCWIRNTWRLRHTHGLYGKVLRTMRTDPKMFESYFRMSYDQFQLLLSMVKPHLTKESHRALNPGIRLAITLRYLASGMSQKDVALNFLVGFTTASNVIRETLGVLWHVLSPKYLPEPDTDMWLKTARLNMDRYQVPLCCGFVDGKHVKCRNLPHHGTQLFNYKKEYSLVLLAVCDANCKILAVDIGQYGSIKNSEFGKKLFSGTLGMPGTTFLPDTQIPFEYYFIGDEAFPLHKHIQRPYGGKFLSFEKRVYNARLSRGRSSIERCFGIMCATWRILLNRIDGNESTIEGIIQACVTLHNFLIVEKQKNSQTERSSKRNHKSYNSVTEKENKSKKQYNTARDALKVWFNVINVIPWINKKVRQGKM